MNRRDAFIPLLCDTYGVLWDIRQAVYWATVNGAHYCRVNFTGPPDRPTNHHADLGPMLPPGKQ